MTGTTRFFLPVLAVVITATVHGAESENTEDDLLLEEIVVEGEREHVALDDTSHSIAVFTATQLERDTDRVMEDLLIRVPNVTTDPFSGNPVIRGIAQGGIGRLGAGGSLPTVNQYADGIFSPIPPTLWDTRQVEVVRGGEAYMSNGVIGGITSVHSNDPSEEVEGRITTSWSPEPDERELGLVYGAPITDTVGYRIAGHLRASDGSFHNVTRADDAWNSRDERMLRLKLLWSPAESDTDVTLRAERYEQRWNGSDVVVGGVDVDPFERDAFANLSTDENITNTSASVELTHRFDDRWSTNVRASWISNEPWGHSDCDDGAESSCRFRYDIGRDFAGIAVRLFYDNGPWHAFFRQSGLHLDVSPARQGVFFPIDFDGPEGLPGVEVGFETTQPTSDWWFVGTQAGVRREFGRLALTASLLRSGQTLDGAERGLRTFREGSTGDAQADADYDFVFANFFPQAYVREDLNDYNYLPTFVADYALTDDITIGAKFEKTARLAGVFFNVARQTANVYDDEFADGYDLFLRSSWLDGRLSVRINAFYTEITDQQVFVWLSGTLDDGQIVNAKRSHNKGLELETAYTQGMWRVWFSAGLLRAEIDDLEFFEVDFSGNDSPNAPDWTLSGGLLFGGDLGPFVELDAIIRPETLADLANVPDVVNERRALVNARAGWAFDQVEVSTYARNLLDDEYREFHDPNTFGGGARQLHIVGDPREVGVTVTVSL